jgi:uncharacterized membrane protein (DUF2068 family)
MPDRSEIEVPARGPELRDRWVLRLIAVDRAVHVLLLTLLAVALFTFATHDHALHRDYSRIMSDLSGGGPGEAQVRGVLGYLGRAFKYSPHRLVQLGILLLALAALEGCEMVGLWMAKRWAEYLTFVATCLFVPLEIYELTNGVSVLKVLALVINVAIVVYLLVAKRLFGVRGGYRAERERRERERGWTAIDLADPVVPAGPDGTAPTPSAARSG